MSEPFLGQITLFPYTFPPFGWADCQGQLLPISQYSGLFALLGVNYGGNGTTNFALPDLRGRVALGMGALTGGSTYSLGEVSGEETVQLIGTQNAPHTHSLNASQNNGTTNAPVGNVLATVFATDVNGTASEGDIYNPGNPDTTLSPQSILPAGGGIPHNNMQPFLTLRYCIALTGVFPSRP